jgi:hypothetical protein
MFVVLVRPLQWKVRCEMAKAKMVRYVAVMDGYDKKEVNDLQLFVKTTLNGSADKVETKTVKGVQKTGVGIVIPQKMEEGLVKLSAPCWTMYSKGEYVVEPLENAPKMPPKRSEGKKGATVPPTAKNASEGVSDGKNEGCGTGDSELEEYLEECEKRGCSYGEISLLIPSSAKPNRAFANSGYRSFMRDGGTPKGNPRLPNEWKEGR